MEMSVQDLQVKLPTSALARI